MTTPLYNTAILRLAASIPHDSRLPEPHATAERRSPVCGSRIVVDVTMQTGRVAALGQDVHACALGQAAAALMGAHAIGRTPAELDAARQALADYLAGRRAEPGDWPGLDVLAPARPHTARHAAILLPFEAVSLASLLPHLSPTAPAS